MQAFVSALKSLRKILAALKPRVPVMPDGSIYFVGHDEPAVVQACCDILEAIADTQENRYFRISAIRIQAELQGVHLRPVPWEFFQRIDKLIEEAGGKTNEPQGGPWSKPDTPKRWAAKFDVDVQTFKRWVKADPPKLRVKILSDRSYQVHVEDLPQS